MAAETQDAESYPPCQIFGSGEVEQAQQQQDLAFTLLWMLVARSHHPAYVGSGGSLHPEYDRDREEMYALLERLRP